MAADGKLPPIAEELTDIETIESVNAKLAEKENRIKTELARKREEALAEYSLQLSKEGLEITSDEYRKKQLEFLNKYKIKQRELEEKELKEKQKQEMKDLINYFKEKSKLSEKEQKKEDKLLKQQLEVAKLRSQEKEDGTPKGFFEKLGNNLVADFKENKTMMGESVKDVGKNMVKGLANLGDKLSGEINAVIGAYSKYQSAINTRLQGSTETFQSVEKTLTSTLGMTPFFRTEAMLEGLNELVDKGIAFNLEQRAFLSTVSEKISTTFDVANASLLRIVKLQQADSSASRLGMEAYLTRFFNNMFQDTQYLTESFDTVTSALLEATSLMGSDIAVEFEYIVQKWLGSLSAVGMSSSAIQGIAEAIGYIGSGNISALESSKFQNLMVMAASRAGLDYSSILTEGLNAYNTNTLLSAVVGYMHEIGSSSSNVVKSQYAETFGLSVSDLQAAGNLQAGDIEVLNNSLMSYQGTIEELEYQLNQVGARTSISEKIENMMKNIKYGIGQGIAQSPVMAGMWSITDLIQSVTGGINIPTVSVLGSSVDLNTTVENLIKLGMVGVSTLGKLGDLSTGLKNKGDMGGLINRYGLGDIQQVVRGNELPSRQSGMSTSSSAFVGTSSGGDIASQVQREAQYAAETELSEKAGEQRTSNETSNDIFNYLVFLLDPKLAQITQLLGGAVGYNLDVTSAETAADTNQEYIYKFGTTVAAASSDESSTKKLDLIKKLDINVEEILKTLQGGITVSLPELYTLFPSPWGG